MSFRLVLFSFTEETAAVCSALTFHEPILKFRSAFVPIPLTFPESVLCHI